MRLWRYGYAIDKLGQRYRLVGLLGSGAMADVCLAWDEREKREGSVSGLVDLITSAGDTVSDRILLRERDIETTKGRP